MLTFFDKVPKISGKMWERFHSIADTSETAVKRDAYFGNKREFIVDMLEYMENHQVDDIDIWGFELSRGKYKRLSDYDNLKKVSYINSTPFENGECTLQYGDVSENRLPYFDEETDEFVQFDVDKTIEFLVKQRRDFFYKEGFDWVSVVFNALNGEIEAIDRLVEYFIPNKFDSRAEDLKYILKKGQSVKEKLEKYTKDTSWIY